MKSDKNSSNFSDSFEMVMMHTTKDIILRNNELENLDVTLSHVTARAITLYLSLSISFIFYAKSFLYN
jgi:hypothetical protein